MTEAQRHQILLELLAQTGFITVEKVIERLGISPATARRDINKLDESGKLKKVRNGAEAISQQRPRWTPMNIHQAQNHDEKVRIARAASQLVNWRKRGDQLAVRRRFCWAVRCAASRCKSSPTICRWPTISLTRNMKAW